MSSSFPEPAVSALKARSEGSIYDPFAGMKTPGQRHLITLQEQVKMGVLTVDEAVLCFKEWQLNQKRRSESFRFQQVCGSKSAFIDVVWSMDMVWLLCLSTMLELGVIWWNILIRNLEWRKVVRIQYIEQTSALTTDQPTSLSNIGHCEYFKNRSTLTVFCCCFILECICIPFSLAYGLPEATDSFCGKEDIGLDELLAWPSRALLIWNTFNICSWRAIRDR